ncbi:MAG: hypothetical protein FD156_1321 [Nitrospirae bacterium]|nr:MAG: hypothetical protein FD156_1321 [Nitrospirota bacterium]
MLKAKTTKQFEKDFKLIIKQGRDLEKLKTIMKKLTNQEPLDMRYKDHKLIGNLEGHRECHIEPNWLLVYRIQQSEETIVFVRTGSHSDIFG